MGMFRKIRGLFQKCRGYQVIVFDNDRYNNVESDGEFKPNMLGFLMSRFGPMTIHVLSTCLEHGVGHFPLQLYTKFFVCGLQLASKYNNTFVSGRFKGHNWVYLWWYLLGSLGILGDYKL